MPITLSGGAFFGTLCAIDPRPARLRDGKTVEMFRLFADLIAQHVDAEMKLAAGRTALAGAQETAALREEFIAVLGHDLKNPLALIKAGTRLLRKEDGTLERGRILDLIDSTTERMDALIEDVLDFARGRLGGGLDLTLNGEIDLAPALAHVVEEARAARPDREIVAAIGRPLRVSQVDAGRLAQLLSNLIGNAIAHGSPDGPIRVIATAGAGTLDISVANAGPPICREDMGRLFQPFERGRGATPRQGLGLGLYIASQIAGAHGGGLEAVSDADETRFSFRMPLAA